uniref:antifungal protein ginkbilobin-like protein n=1 Tax=Erigeron canadensis TaxID=72917 RepID=UPI001CB93C7C|nr:antifungal protein ginkbilobin-like protein [Erigeron canadensis]
MSCLKRLIITGLFIRVFGICRIVESAPNTNVASVLCNSGIYTKGDPFTISLAYVLDELPKVTPYQQGYDYRNISPYPNAFAYGHASCNQNLTSMDCKTCLDAAEVHMLDICSYRIGARAVLNDCAIRSRGFALIQSATI